MLALAPAVLAQPAAPAKAKVDEIFARFNRSDTPGCTVGVSRGGQTLLEAAYGMADLEHGIALAPDSILEAGSVSKQFTAAAVLLLAQAGKLSLDDPARKYIPELPGYGSALTVRHLLHHTSGLRDWGAVADIEGMPRTTRAYGHEHVLEIVGRQRSLNYPPGAHYSYTNSGYNLAAILVSRVAGVSFAEYTRKAIFVPLDMQSTSWRDDFRRIVPRRAVAYTDRPLPPRALMPFENVHGNGGLLTTAGDLLRWNANSTRRTVGGPGFVEAQLSKGRLTGGAEINYAAGLIVSEYRGQPEISHSGATAAYRAWLARYPKQDLSVAVLCNAASADATQLGRDVADLFAAGESQGPARQGEVRGNPAAYAGLYRSRRDQSTMLLESAGGELRLRGQALRVVNGSRFAMGPSVLDFQEEGASRAMRLQIRDAVGDTTTYERVEPWKPSQADLAAMAGDYRSDEAEVTLRVQEEGSGLVVHRRPASRLPLTPRYQDGFENGDLGSVRFLRGPGGSIQEMSLGTARVWDLRLRRLPR